MAVIMTIGLIPMGSVTVKAETKNATLSNLGELGKVKIGNKSESGTWYQTEVAGTPVFCMDLGKACHAGDVYVSSDDTYSSNSSNAKKANEAKIGYWYSVTKSEATKAWVYAQALMWSCEEGHTSKKDLKDVISQVRKNTGYYNSKSAADLYDEIFGITTTVTCNVKIWKYGGSGEYRQVLLEITSTPPLDFPYEKINDTLVYRQRITIDKTDEDGNPVARVPFEVTAQNYKELYDYKVNGWGNAETGDADGDSVFSSVAETDSKGRITYKFNYQIQSKNYGYVKASHLKNMTADDKKAVKEKMDDKNITYASNLTKAGAEKLMKADLDAQMKKISNKYVVKEVDAGSDDMLVNSNYANGKTITIKADKSWTKNSDGKWPETADGTYGDYSKATQLDVVNKYKKASIQVKKNDDYAADGKAHGEATLDGAQYRLYADAACTKLATVYNANGTAKTAGTYTVTNGVFTTNYLRCGVNYYLKEYKAPSGYQLNTKVYTIGQDGTNLTAEYTPNAKTVNVYETPYPGQIAIKKVSSRNENDTVNEAGAKFQVFLKSAGSYDKASDYNRDIINTDENGYGISKPLYKGTYIVHQVANGTLNGKEVDLIMRDDFEVTISGDGTVPVYEYKINNPRFNACLKVIKKDKRTEKTILKAGTTYKIKRYDEDTDTWNFISQTYINNGSFETTDTFVTNESGEIMTYSALESGTYRIYETESVSGTYRDTEYVEIIIHQDNKDNYDTWTDAEGNEHLVVTVEYVNDETKGKFTLDKRGFELTSFTVDEGFKYDSVAMPGTIFEVFAKEDIETQDNQGTYWFRAGDKVATITTGTNVEFTDDCNGICTYNIEDDGSTTMYFPLGKYELKEINTLYSYFLPEVRAWDLEFVWNNQDEEYVFNITDVTNEEGVLSVQNELVKTDVSIFKPDKDTEKPIKDAVFGFYSKDNIYNAKGEIIVKQGEKIATVTTNDEGVAILPFRVPLMSEGYNAEATEEDANIGLNSGNYYWKEESVSKSYYLDEMEMDVHLEYVDQDTDVIVSLSELPNTQTETTISKVALADSVELPYCDLKIDDKLGNTIISWTTGVTNSIVIAEKAEELGYRNLSATMDDKGNLIVKGLFHDEEYKLTETKPCDGYATAESIAFKLSQSVDEEGNVITTASVKGTDGNFTQNTGNKSIMKDDTIKVKIIKIDSRNKEKKLKDAEFTFKLNGEKVATVTTDANGEAYLEGVLAAGTTYVVSETKPPEGYKQKPDFKYTVKDSGEVQVITVKNERNGDATPNAPNWRGSGGKSPLTGDFRNPWTWIIIIAVSTVVLLYANKRRKEQDEAEA